MKFRFSWPVCVCLAVVMAQAILGLAIARYGPTGPIVLHFNLDGAPDGWGHRAVVGALVGIIAATSALAVGGIGILSRRAAEQSPPKSLTIAQTVVLFATSMICGLVVCLTFGWPGPGLPSTRLLMGFLCLLFAGLGAYLGKVDPNPLVGVRTPWSFASRLAWDRSNRLAGRLFFWGGLAGVISAPFAPQPGGLQATVGGVLAIAAVTVFESWRVWRHDPDRISAL